jgi:hypothetical protein
MKACPDLKLEESVGVDRDRYRYGRPNHARAYGLFRCSAPYAGAQRAHIKGSLYAGWRRTFFTAISERCVTATCSEWYSALRNASSPSSALVTLTCFATSDSLDSAPASKAHSLG